MHKMSSAIQLSKSYVVKRIFKKCDFSPKYVKVSRVVEKIYDAPFSASNVLLRALGNTLIYMSYLPSRFGTIQILILISYTQVLATWDYK